MSGKRLQLKRGTTAQTSTFTGLDGEVTVDTTEKTLVVHDGSTIGGTVLAKDSALNSHTARTDNPHAVTKAQVGLDSVNNTADVVKNVLSATKLTTARTIELTGDVTGTASFNGSANAAITATVADNSHNHTITNVTGLQAALDAKVDDTEKGSSNGVATLDVNGKVTLTQIPDSVLGQLEYMGVHNFTTMPTATQKGQYWIASVSGNGYIVGDWAVWNGSAFDKVDNTDAVATVAGRTGNVVLTKSDVGLSNVDNTADASKPVSTTQQTALDLKANLASPTFTGTVTAPTFSGALSGNITGNAATATNVAWSGVTSKPTTIAGYGITDMNTQSVQTTLYHQSPDGDRNSGTKLPNTNPRNVRFDFSSASSAGTEGNYAGVMTYAPWDGTTSSTGDASYQLAFGSTGANGTGIPKLNIRKGIDTTWNSWYTLLHSGNYNSYAPTLTGTGASGTWGINITGNASTATRATTVPGLDLKYLVPSGGIIMWSGSTASIPSGWVLCDGSNNTPNLTNRFVIGAGSSYAVGETGGSADAVVVSHTHSFSGSGTTSTNGAHAHTSYGYQIIASGGSTGYQMGLNANYSRAATTSSAGDHSHTMSISGTTGSTGSSGTNANLPPYYALAYIMKT